MTVYYVGPAATGNGSGGNRSNLMAVTTFVGTKAAPDDVALLQPGDYQGLTSGVFHLAPTRVGTSWDHPITLKADPEASGYAARSADWFERNTPLEAADPAKHCVFAAVQIDSYHVEGDYTQSLPYYWILDGLWINKYVTHYGCNAEVRVQNCVVRTPWTGYTSTAVASLIEFYHFNGLNSDMHGITYKNCYLSGGGRSLKLWAIVRAGGMLFDHCRVTNCFGSFIGDGPANNERYGVVDFNDCRFDTYNGEANDGSGTTQRTIDQVDPANPRRRFHITEDVSPSLSTDFIDFTHGGTAKQGLQRVTDAVFNHSTLWVTLPADAPWDLVAGSDVPRFYDDAHGSGWAMYGDHVHCHRCRFENLGDTATIYVYHDDPADGHAGVHDIEITDCLFYSGGNVWGIYFANYDKLGNNFTFKGNTVVGRYEATQDNGKPQCHYGRAVTFAAGTGADTSTWNISNNLFVGLVTGSVGNAVRCNNILYGHTNLVSPYVWLNEFRASGASANQGNVAVYAGEPWGSEPTPFSKAGKYFAAEAANFDDVYWVWPFNYNLAADFHLKPGSPALGTGSAAHRTGTDLLGRPRHEPPDVGCYEDSGTGGGQGKSKWYKARSERILNRIYRRGRYS